MGRLVADLGRDDRQGDQQDDPAGLWRARLALPARRPDRPDRLFARRLCRPVARRRDRAGRVAQAPARDRQRDPDLLSPLRGRGQVRRRPRLQPRLLPRAGRDRGRRDLGHGQGAGPAAAAALAADGGPARLSRRAAGRSRAERLSRAGARRKARGLCPGPLGMPVRLSRPHGTGLVPRHAWRRGRSA